MTFIAHPYDRLLMGSPLRRRRVCILVCFGLAGLLGFSALVQFAVVLTLPMDAANVFLVALAFSTALSAIPVAALWFLDRRERESRLLFVAAFLWGGCIATGLALPFNTAFFAFVDVWVMKHPVITEILGRDATTLIAAPISAPIVEEITKALGVVLIFWLLRPEFDNMRDGIVYGALVGLGFNWFEAALYVAQGYAQSGIPPFGTQLGARFALFGFGGHALFTSLFGAFLGLAIQTKYRWLRVVAPIAGLLLAVAAHMLNNALPIFAALVGADAEDPGPQHEILAEVGFVDAWLSGTFFTLAVFLPFLLIMAIAVWRSGVWERRVIRDELANEIGDAVTPREYEAIVADGIFRTRRIDGGMPRRSATLINAQHELAFSKRRARHAGRDPELDPIAAGWRADIRRLRETM